MSEVNLEKILPLSKKVRRHEVVLDARVCVLSGCPLLRKQQVGGQEVYNCGAQIFEADVPRAELDAETRLNPRPQADVENSSFLLRILMAPENTTEYCGLGVLNYEEEVLDLTAEQEVEEIFTEAREQV